MKLNEYIIEIEKCKKETAALLQFLLNQVSPYKLKFDNQSMNTWLDGYIAALHFIESNNSEHENLEV